MLSTKFRTIFVHIPKAAGQSIETVFLEQHGLDWEARAPLLLRRNDDPSKGPERLAHLYAREYVKFGYVSQADFDSFYKFAVVRDPYARIVSAYRFQWAAKMPFREFIEERFANGRMARQTHNMTTQLDFVTDEAGKIVVDDILRFEDLPGAFDAVSRRVFGKEIPLPHVNKSKAADPGVEFTPDLRAIVREKYAKDFEAFGYPD